MAGMTKIKIKAMAATIPASMVSFCLFSDLGIFYFSFMLLPRW
jgi:hypothetical protein